MYILRMVAAIERHVCASYDALKLQSEWRRRCKGERNASTGENVSTQSYTGCFWTELAFHEPRCSSRLLYIMQHDGRATWKLIKIDRSTVKCYTPRRISGTVPTQFPPSNASFMADWSSISSNVPEFNWLASFQTAPPLFHSIEKVTAVYFWSYKC